ncbi:MAG: GNAT family N-acetyltransferase [Gammaproteobacteria bacterium]|nr:GNAT family N-acetyltransferase [Gammaproteobacteria bacterium]
MLQNAQTLENAERRFVVELAHNQATIAAAQKLRYQVFRDTYGADLGQQPDQRDHDHFDLFCEHLFVRDLQTDQIIATTRLLANTGDCLLADLGAVTGAAAQPVQPDASRSR